MTANSQCSLCSNLCTDHLVLDDQNAFCCIGCQAVYRILSSKKQLENFEDSDLFKQAIRAGLISNPALIEQMRRTQVDVPNDEKIRLHLEIGEMWCPSCAEVIRLILLQQKGVLNCVVDYATDLASIEYAPRYISKDKIIKSIQALGYDSKTLDTAGKTRVSKWLYLRLVVAAFFSLNVMMFSYPIYASYFAADDTGTSSLFVWLAFFASLPVITFSAWPILKRFWNAFSVGIIGMESLIVLGVSSAFSLSIYEMLHGSLHVYFDSMCVIITFVLFGKVIESKAKFSAKDSLIRLTRAIPKRGRKRFENGSETFVFVKDIEVNDYLVVHTGEKIVLDGVVTEGVGSCDESVMTGEAIPVQKQQNDSVLSGTVLTQGSIVYKVTATEEETALHRIISMVEQDVGNKSVYTRAVDPIIIWFVPSVIVIAFGTAIGCFLNGNTIEVATLRAISILLISCPCAIGIAAPLVESQLLNQLANLGAIVRNRGCLSFLGNETVFVFDKTGTITQGRFEVISGLEKLSLGQRGLLKGLVNKSSHPISVAISNALIEKPQALTSQEEVSGKGMQGRYKEDLYRLGSPEWTETEIQTQTETQVNFTENGTLLASIILGDQLKEGAVEVVQSIKPAQTYLLSGDGKQAVNRIAQECGFDLWRARCHPLDKRNMIDELRKKGEIVGMIGDGINDSPALTGANVGISVVSASDISIQVSDLLLTTDRLEVLPQVRRLSQKGQKIIKQNLFWAFFYNVIGIGLALAGYLNPIISALAMVLSSLFVLFNARRLR